MKWRTMGMVAWILTVGGILIFVSSARAADSPAVVLTQADTMEKVFRDEPWKRPPATVLSLEVARNEAEGIQLVVAPTGKEGLKSLTLEVTDLRGEGGGTIPGSQVTWNVVGYVATEKPGYPVRKVGWWPDPLLPSQACDIPAGRVQPLWITVKIPAETRSGLYRGNVILLAAGRPLTRVPLEVRVWNFVVPREQHLDTCFPLRPDDLQKFYRLKEVPLEMFERWVDFCNERRVCPALSDWHRYSTDMERLAARQLNQGGACFCLGYAWFQQGNAEARKKHNADQVARIRSLYDRVKKQGWIRQAYIYVHDEISKEQYPFARELYADLKKSMPDLRLMQTFYKDSPCPALEEVMDIWAPNTARYRPDEFKAQQAKGRTIWWYVCCGPGQPFANLMIEWPAIDHRILLWQNWKYGVTGFLYWGLNVWRDNLAGERRWPEVPWNPATWRNDAGLAHNGDGQLLYPGPDGRPLSSIRLENFRDGIEDYEYFWLLREAVGQLERKPGNQQGALLAEAKKVLALDDPDLVQDLTHFTQDPAKLRQARRNLARLIERVQGASR